MKNKMVPYVFVAIVIGLTFGSIQAKASEDGEVYTQVNMWIERPKPIPTTNYHKGERIPIGTKVKILSKNSKQVQFSCNGQTLTLLKMKHTTVGMDVVEKRTFGASDPLASDAFKALPETHQTAVKNGQIVVGMVKSTVLMAYGYPPEHKTPTTDANDWLFWLDKFRSQKVTFTDGKVSAMTGF